VSARNDDIANLRDYVRGPGIDTRTWISYARIDPLTDDQGNQAIEFDDVDGQLYINCTLMPSNIPVRCRKGMLAAGSGEAVYFPHQPGDEVLVAIPEGNPRAGCVILCALNNAFDTFPTGSVAGVDPSQNAVGLFRMKAALTIESGASVMLRSAAAGAFLRLDGGGNVTLRDTAANVLQMTPDVFGYQNSEGDMVLQLDHNAQRFNLTIGQAQLMLSGDSSQAHPQSYLQAPSSLTVATAGGSINTAVEHVATTEAVANILAQVFNALGLTLTALGAAPLTGASLGALLVDPVFSATNIVPALTLASTSPLSPAVASVLASLFSSPSPKPPGVPGQGQTFPALGCAGFLAG
jgi:hypothetical protein